MRPNSAALPPYTGPLTGDFDASLEAVARLAEAGAAAAVTTVLPPYTGPETGDQAAVPGRHRAPQPERGGAIRRHGRKLASFSVIGAGVFIAGLALQAALTSGLHLSSLASYVIQAVASVEASYLLNRRLTWKGAGSSFRGSFARFNLQKAVTVAANLVLYGLLLRLGVEYLLANVLLTALFTIVNYAAADRLVFLRPGRAAATATAPLPAPLPARAAAPRRRRVPRELPSVSVVIPVRSSEKTILAAVESVLSQDYPALRELVLVGSPGDSTWSALREVRDPRLLIVETETPPGVRDANYKRDLGIGKAAGDLVSLVDSDMVLPPDWLAGAVRLLLEGEADCVAGVMRSARDDFWGRFVDGNRLGAKTPRAEGAYLVTAEGFGMAGFKPPITANILFTRKMYEDCPIDPLWSHGSLEDYEWFWRVAERGHQVLVSSELFGWHHHRAGLGNLAREYRRSARGCAYFIRAHSGSPFARRRMTQAAALVTGAFGLLLAVTLVVCAGYGALALDAVAAAAGGGLVLLAAREFAASRTAESLLYPLPALILGASYTASLVAHLSVNAWADLAPRRPAASRVTVAFLMALAAGTAVRLWRLGTSPAWQWDEGVYWRVSVNVQHGQLAEHALYGQPGEPFLYQPPFYFAALSRWFDVFGASIYHARLLGVLCTAVMLALLFVLLRRLHGPRIALAAALPVIFDGWLLYIERASYIENALMVLVVLGFLLYQRALESPATGRFLLAGASLGAAASFKQTGAYVIAAVLLCWLVTRRQRRGHLVLLGAAAGVIGAYLLLMALKYDPWFTDQSLVQVRRVLGLQKSGGTLTSPARALHLLGREYAYFLPSLLLAGAAAGIAAGRAWQCLRARSWEPVRANALLWSWLVTGLAVFGASSLKFPQYFVLILLPAYCYLWTELARSGASTRRRGLLPVAAAAIGLGSFLLTVPAFNVNSLSQVQAYAARSIPAGAVVVTEQSIGNLIRQRWCTVEKPDACAGHATYAITWQTYLQSSFTQGNTSFYKIMRGAVPVTSFDGSAGAATVWKLRAGA